MSAFSQSAGLFRYRDVTGVCRAALVIPGRKKLHVVYITNSGVCAHALDASESRYFTPLEGDARCAAKRMRKAGKLIGITKSARELLHQFNGGQR